MSWDVMMMTGNEGNEKCWQQVGVWGKNQRCSCPRLDDVVHCQNCPVYREAGRQLFERSAPADYIREWTQALSEPPQSTPEETVGVLLFRIRNQWLALRPHVFHEILEIEPYWSSLHTVPHRQNPILKGLINIHGEIELCVALEKLLGISESGSRLGDRQEAISRLAVVHDGNGGRWVFAVDEIFGLQAIGLSSFENVPATVGNVPNRLTRGVFTWREAQAALLEPERLFEELSGSVR